MSVTIEEIIAETSAEPREDSRRRRGSRGKEAEPQQALILRHDLVRCNALIQSRRDRLDAE